MRTSARKEDCRVVGQSHCLKIRGNWGGKRDILASETCCFSFISGTYSILAAVFCHHPILFSVFSLSNGLLEALQSVPKYHTFQQTGL